MQPLRRRGQEAQNHETSSAEMVIDNTTPIRTRKRKYFVIDTVESLPTDEDRRVRNTGEGSACVGDPSDDNETSWTANDAAIQCFLLLEQSLK